MRKLLVDVDAGSDDAWALMLLLAHEINNQYKVVAITCSYGNTTLDYVCRNVLLTLQAMDRTDVPVYKGAAGPIMKNSRPNVEWHGKDGFGDGVYDAPDGDIQEENAIAAINRLANENPGITVMCLGPLTNLALALRSYPTLSRNIGEFWVMGGNIQAVGNVPDTTAEFNFHQDPEAASIVLDQLICKSVMLPWEPCINLPISTEWRFQTLGSIKSKKIELMNKVEQNPYKGYSHWCPCDGILAAAFANERVITSARDVHMVVEVQGARTRGQCVILEGKTPNIRVIEQVDCNLLRDAFMRTVSNK